MVINVRKPTYKLLSPDGTIDPVLYTDNSGDAYCTGSLVVGEAVTPDLALILVSEANPGGFGFDCYSATASDDPIMYFRKSHSDTAGTPVGTVNGESLGQFQFRGIGTDNGVFRSAARIKSTQLSSGSNYVNGDLTFSLNNGLSSFVDTLDLYAPAKVRMGNMTLAGSSWQCEVGGRARISNNGGDTTLFLDNSATDGDPQIKFSVVGGSSYQVTAGVDDSLSGDPFIIGATNLSTTPTFYCDPGVETRIGTIATNYVSITYGGNLKFVGTAGFYPRRIAQSTIPASGTGSTQIDVGESLIWHDTDDGKIYMVYNDTSSGVKSIELT